MSILIVIHFVFYFTIFWVNYSSQYTLLRSSFLPCFACVHVNSHSCFCLTELITAIIVIIIIVIIIIRWDVLVWLRKDIEAVLFGTIVRKFMRLGSIMSKCLKASRYTLQKGLYVNLTIILGRYGNKLPPAKKNTESKTIIEYRSSYSCYSRLQNTRWDNSCLHNYLYRAATTCLWS